MNTSSGTPFAHNRCICIGSRTVDQAVETELFKHLTPQAVRCAYQIQEELEPREAQHE